MNPVELTCKVNEWFEEKGWLSSCCRESGSVGIYPAVIELAEKTVFGVPYGGVPSVMAVCNNCHQIFFFSAKMMGLVEDKKIHLDSPKESVCKRSDS